jgi:catechol 2,3-dioxygenase-like lactoylglutathione lyase family enzyme
MKPWITVITLGVDDLERALRFYRDGLGLPTKGIVGTEVEHGAVAFFDLQHGLKLAIWPRASLAHEAKVPLGPRSATEFALGHNVERRIKRSRESFLIARPEDLFSHPTSHGEPQTSHPLSLTPYPSRPRGAVQN